MILLCGDSFFNHEQVSEQFIYTNSKLTASSNRLSLQTELEVKWELKKVALFSRQ